MDGYRWLQVQGMQNTWVEKLWIHLRYGQEAQYLSVNLSVGRVGEYEIKMSELGVGVNINTIS